MEWHEHRMIGAATAVGVSALVGLPLSSLMITVPSAVSSAVLPDRAERGPLGLWEIKHRTKTHWISSCILMALVPAIIFAISLHELTPLAREHLPHGVVSYLSQGVVMFLILFAIGRLCGCISHTLADATTISGSPLWGPWSKRDIHLFPKWVHMRYDSALAKFISLLSLIVAGGIIYFQIKSGARIEFSS